MKRVSEREEDDDEESMNGEGTRAHAMFALLLLVEDVFVVIFAGDFFFCTPLLVYFISVFVDSVH